MMNVAVLQSLHACLRTDFASLMNPIIMEVNSPLEIESIKTASIGDKGKVNASLSDFSKS